jgi:hypothetical protein
LGLKRGDVQVHPDYVSEAVWAGFVGAACETVERLRGRPVPVAPLSPLGSGELKAWLGFQEVWDGHTSGRRFTFRHLSLTVHFGYNGDPVKPQVFRSEWSGIRDWTGAGMDFQSPGAAHPHWQFDVMESLRDMRTGRDELSRLSEEEVEAEEFTAEGMKPDVRSAIRATTLERMHFAGAAPWWKPDDSAQKPYHMNAPSDDAGLLRWAVQCIAYVKQELARCELRR